MVVTINIHHRHLLLLLSPKAGTHFTVPLVAEGCVDLGTAVRCAAHAQGHIYIVLIAKYKLEYIQVVDQHYS